MPSPAAALLSAASPRPSRDSPLPEQRQMALASPRTSMESAGTWTHTVGANFRRFRSRSRVPALVTRGAKSQNAITYLMATGTFPTRAPSA